MKIIKGGVTAPKGFLAGAVSCGIKKSGRNDSALLCSEVPCVAVGTFTTNRFKSGSVILSMKRLKSNRAQAVIVNSGNANACVGERGIKDAENITGLLARAKGIDKDLVLVASTGVIGKVLPVEKILDGIKPLVDDLSVSNGTKFSKAIMTTDTKNKEIAVEINLGGKSVRIAGAVKGAGMICPNMATMLAFFTTDVVVENIALKSAFKEAVNESFNKIIVDGDMSTNDSAIIFSNGLAGNRCIKKGEADYFKFLAALKFVAKELARKIVIDGEGATKFVEVVVKGANNVGSAEKIARRIATSSLVKTMLAGGDPNWGRIAASVGSSGIKINPERVDIYFGKNLVMRNGVSTGISRKILLAIFKKREIEIVVDLKSGQKSSRMWTCDLTEEYVRINAEYET